MVSLLSLAPENALATRNYNYDTTTMNQKDTGGYASNNFWNGSGDSKTEGVNNAMIAIGCLGALDIGCAISHGYQGYGQYINSQRMDDLNAAAWNVKAALASAGDQANITGSTDGSGNGGGPQSGITGSTTGSGASSAGQAAHTLASMDRGFLYRGQTGDIASEFEKKSGMSREDFFNELADAEASGLSWNDPNLMEKMDSRFQSFVSKVPNQDFRANLEKMHDMMTAAKKLDLFEKAADFYKENRWGNGGDKAAQDAAAAKAAALAAQAAGVDRKPASDAAASALAGAAPSVNQIAKVDDKAPKLTKEQMGMYLGLEGAHGDDLNDLIGPEDTIFRLVSKRYRKLTPMMIGRAL